MNSDEGLAPVGVCWSGRSSKKRGHDPGLVSGRLRSSCLQAESPTAPSSPRRSPGQLACLAFKGALLPMPGRATAWQWLWQKKAHGASMLRDMSESSFVVDEILDHCIRVQR